MSQEYHRPKRRAGPHTSWEPVARWYDGWVGKKGSKYHRKIVIPAVLELASLAPGTKVLEVGSGQGVLTPHIARIGAQYTGVDVSQELIRLARKRHGHQGRFLLCDARRLFECPQLQPKEFDVVIFMLSIQDMEPLQAVIQSANRVLKPRGCFILVMVHPCFRVPRQSGWGWDSRRKIQYRRVDRYLTPLAVPMQPYSGGTTRSFHRPLSEYVNCLAESGLVVNCMKEIPTYEVVTAGKHTRAENRAHQQIPLFLSLRAMKVGDISESELSS